MESKAKKILIYKVRNFSEKFDDTFAFVRENWKVLFKYLTYFVLPVCLVQAIGLNNYLDAAFDMSTANAGRSSDVVGMLQNLGWNYGVIVLTSMIGAMLQLSVVYAFISHYNSSEDLSGGVDGSMFKPLLIKNLKRSGLAILFWIGLTLLGMLITILLGYLLSWWILLPVILVAVAVCIPLMLFMPAYLLEDIPLSGALSKSLRLGFATWWGTFAIIFVLGFIVSFFQGIFAIPYYITIVVKTIMGLQGGNEFFDSAGYSFMTYLFGVLQSFATYLVGTIVAVGLAIQYGHASEKIDHVTMEDHINRFEEL